MRQLPGSNFREEAPAAVGYLSALFTVCSLALSEVPNWSPEVRKHLYSDIKAVMDLGALLAHDVSELAERNIDDAANPEGA